MRAILVAAALLSFAFVPAALAAPEDPYRCVREGPPCDDAECYVGPNERCLVTFAHRVCVTEPCDELDLCVVYGRLCVF